MKKTKMRLLIISPIATIALLTLSGCHHSTRGIESEDGTLNMKIDTLNLKSIKEQGYDKGTAPNEAGEAIFARLEDEATSLETIYSYFTHYSPVMRFKASQAMSKRGKASMPFLIKALQSGDKYQIRAACDAISQVRQFFGVSVKTNRRTPQSMTLEINAEAVPYMSPLLDHENMYIRAGALQALSRCGKAAAPHLPKVATFITDDEWWLRGGAAYVLQGVGSPEADKYLPSLAKTMLTERRIQCLNIMSATLKDLIRTSSNRQQLAEQIGEGLGQMHDYYHRLRGRDVLDAAGTDAGIALPYVNKLIAEMEETLKDAEPDSRKTKADQAELKQLKTTRDKLSGVKK